MKRLKKDAVPSIFEFPKHLLNSKVTRCPAKRKAPSPKRVVHNKKPRLVKERIKHDHSYNASPAKVIPKMKKIRGKKEKEN